MKSISLVILLIFVSPTSNLLAQKEGGSGIFSSRAEYRDFMGAAKSAAKGDPEMKGMILMLNDIALNRPVGSSSKQYGGTSNTFGLVSDAEVRADIEMLDGQYEELKNRNSKIQKRAAEQLRQLDFSDTESLVEKVKAIRQDAADELNSVLLPHQLDRLRQIGVQAQFKNRGLIDVLKSDSFRLDLEISDEQIDELKEEAKLIEGEMAAEIAKLRKRARDRLLAKLKPDQRAAVNEMIGGHH